MMTQGPNFSYCSNLSDAQVNYNSSMFTPPNFVNCYSMTQAQVIGNASMISGPNFGGCFSLQTASLQDNQSMTVPPDFSSCNQIGQINLSSCSLGYLDTLAMFDQIYNLNSPYPGTIDVTGSTMPVFNGYEPELLNLTSQGWTVLYNS